MDEESSIDYKCPPHTGFFRHFWWRDRIYNIVSDSANVLDNLIGLLTFGWWYTTIGSYISKKLYPVLWPRKEGP